MKRYIVFVVLFAMLIGRGLAENVKTGDLKAFQKALKGWIYCTTGRDRVIWI